uniref:Uncharacterized protein n=1 Tax=Romanomermis culicivorax TaxID=13658 RepID=A0A915KVD0_ROMCU
MESAFGEHMIKCIILDNDGNNQCIIGTDFLAHPNIQAVLNFKENFNKIQDAKLPLKVIAAVRSQMELFLNPANDNQLVITSIPDVKVQPLATNNVAAELPIETAIVDLTNGHCLLLFINNTPNCIKLRPNQLIAMAKHMLGYIEPYPDCQLATAASNRDLADH